MTPDTAVPGVGSIVYPESDGKPMADNTLQAECIVVLYDNLKALYSSRADVFVAANNFWYPVEGHSEIKNAPDVYVVFGRPKGYRGSYKQWEEENIPLTIVFEILSPGNTVIEMDDKHEFYERYGVEEYYLYDPDNNRLLVYQRKGDVLRRVRPGHNFVSPRLGVRFDLSGPELVVFGPDGQRFLTFEELKAARIEAQQRAEQAERRVTRMAELSRKARRGLATPEEVQELERLEDESLPPSP